MMNEERLVKFHGTPQDFNRFVEAMESEGLVVRLESMSPLKSSLTDLDFLAIQLIAIRRLAKELATRLDLSEEEVSTAFIEAACQECLSFSQEQKTEIVEYFYRILD